MMASVDTFSDPVYGVFQMISYVVHHDNDCHSDCLHWSNEYLKRGVDVRQWLANNIDLDFCKVFFDGRSLEIANVDSLIQRKSEYSESHVFETNRGSIHQEKILARIRKYRNRGFEVTIPRRISYLLS